MISIFLNGEPREVPEGLTLLKLLGWLKLPRDRIAVERNLEIVPRGRWQETPIEAGDRLEVVTFVGGGLPLAGWRNLSREPWTRVVRSQLPVCSRRGVLNPAERDPARHR